MYTETINPRRLCSRAWQRRLALIGWLVLALAVFLPAIFITYLGTDLPSHMIVGDE